MLKCDISLSTWRQTGLCSLYSVLLLSRQTQLRLAMAQEVNADGLVPVTDACVGESLYVNTYKAIGIVKYVGTTDFSKGIWIGLELDEPIGKNDGSVQGKHYFPCRPHHGVFVRETACFRLKSTTKSSSSATKVSDIVQEARPGVVSSPELPTVPSEIVRPPLPPPPLNHLNTVQVQHAET